MRLRDFLSTSSFMCWGQASMREVLQLSKKYYEWFFYGFIIALSISFVSPNLKSFIPGEATTIAERATTIIGEPVMIFTPVFVSYLAVWKFVIYRALNKPSSQTLGSREIREIAVVAILYLLGVTVFLFLVEAFSGDIQHSFVALIPITIFLIILIATYTIKKIPLERLNHKVYRFAAFAMFPFWILIITLTLGLGDWLNSKSRLIVQTFANFISTLF